jgi:hypothetical protein
MIHSNSGFLCIKMLVMIGHAWKTLRQSMLGSALSDKLCLFGDSKIPLKEDKMRYCTTDFALFSRQTLLWVTTRLSSHCCPGGLRVGFPA